MRPPRLLCSYKRWVRVHPSVRLRALPRTSSLPVPRACEGTGALVGHRPGVVLSPGALLTDESVSVPLSHEAGSTAAFYFGSKAPIILWYKQPGPGQQGSLGCVLGPQGQGQLCPGVAACRPCLKVLAPGDKDAPESLL